jgi:hypothetical protein
MKDCRVGTGSPLHPPIAITDVHAGKIAYYVEAGRGAASETRHGEVIFGRSHSAAHTREIAEWVASHYPGTVIGESTVYRLT